MLLLCTAVMILTSQRTRSRQARYSQTVNTGRRKLQLLVLNTVVNSLWTLVLVHTATFALEPEESLDNSKPGLFEEGFGNFPQVLDMAIPVLTIQIYFGLYLFLCYYYCFSLHPLRASSAPHIHNSHKLCAGAVSSVGQFQWHWPI